MNDQDYFILNDKNELKNQLLKEKTFINDIVKNIKKQEIKEIRDEHKAYNVLLTPVKKDIISIMNNNNLLEYATDFSLYKNDYNILRVKNS